MERRATMDVKQVVGMAKEYIAELYHDEEIMYVGLEEVYFDHEIDKWQVTIGFARPWDGMGGRNPVTRDSVGVRSRSYKVACINDKTGQIESIKDRILVDPALR